MYRLPYFSHFSTFLLNLKSDFDGYDAGATANKRGLVVISSSDVAITAIGLRFNPSGSFTSIPIIRSSN